MVRVSRHCRAMGAAGRTVISFAGMLVDPRAAYSAADIVVGMGSSALRAMAFAKRRAWQPRSSATLESSLELEKKAK